MKAMPLMFISESVVKIKIKLTYIMGGPLQIRYFF
jgi:hypothetical protein